MKARVQVDAGKEGMMRHRIHIATLFAALLAPAVARADDAPSPQVVRLSPEQAQAAIESGSARSNPPGMLDPGPNSARAIHGEIGAMIGSNGARGAYGTAAIPIGDDGGAVVSFASERYRWR
jgi:hypothetical protein